MIINLISFQPGEWSAMSAGLMTYVGCNGCALSQSIINNLYLHCTYDWVIRFFTQRVFEEALESPKSGPRY